MLIGFCVVVFAFFLQLMGDVLLCNHFKSVYQTNGSAALLARIGGFFQDTDAWESANRLTSPCNLSAPITSSVVLDYQQEMFACLWNGNLPEHTCLSTSKGTETPGAETWTLQ
jgi:hypothetical protein